MREAESPATIAQAADMGIAGYVDSWAPDDVQGAIEVALRRHRDEQRLHEKVEQLESALERRAVIERAKGILMERHAVDERRGVRAAARPRALAAAGASSTSRRACSTGTRCCRRAQVSSATSSSTRADGPATCQRVSRWTIARLAAGLGDQQRAGEPVPGVGVGLDPGVEPAGGDPGELERARAGVAEQAGCVEQPVGDVADARAATSRSWRKKTATWASASVAAGRGRASARR